MAYPSSQVRLVPRLGPSVDQSAFMVASDPVNSRRICGGPSCTALLLMLHLNQLALTARAAEPTDVEAILAEANDLRRQGKDHKALPLMQKAHDLASTSRTAAQLGLVEIALG